MERVTTTDLFERAYTGVCRDAAISDCTRYRYWLKRWWDDDAAKPWACFVMLNPSTADAAKDDPTIRRCTLFARAWGCVGIYVVNLFALRSPNPALLRTVVNPVGPDNDWHIKQAFELAKGPIVAAWGAHPFAATRARSVRELVAGVEMKCLGTTKGGHPKHPLYVADGTPLVSWGATQS